MIQTDWWSLRGIKIRAPEHIHTLYAPPARLPPFTNRMPAMDLIFIGLIFAFFALTAAMVYGFERLRKPQ